MAIKKYKPTTPGRRGQTTIDYKASGITTDKPHKPLLVSKKRQGGRNSQGKITVRHQGGGHKKKYRLIDFNRTDKLGIAGKVSTIEYDPNRSAFIMLVTYKDGDKRYHIAPNGIKVGDRVYTAEKTKVKVGNRMQLKHIPVGYSIFNIEMHNNKGGQLIKSAGSSAKITSLEGQKAQVELPSGEIRLIEKTCYASIGQVSNLDHGNVVIGKAGRKRWMGKKPQVRGKAMNPNDHPHGGGEGGSPIGLKNPKTPWGAPALGKKTRRRKYTDKFIVRSRHLKKKKK